MKAGLAALAVYGVMLSHSVQAAVPGTALVVGNDVYAGRPVLPNCAAAAQEITARLRRLGYTVEETRDQPSIALRISVMRFTAGVAAGSGAPAIVYVCAEAAIRGDRLFILPTDLDPRQDVQPETQGIAVRSLLNGLGHDAGMLVAELALPPGASGGPALDALDHDMPPRLHVALAVEEAQQAGALGKVLADDTLRLDDWATVVGRLRPAAGPGVTVKFAPEPSSPASPVSPVASQPAAPPSLGTSTGSGGPPQTGVTGSAAPPQTGAAIESSDAPGQTGGVTGSAAPPQTGAAIGSAAPPQTGGPNGSAGLPQTGGQRAAPEGSAAPAPAGAATVAREAPPSAQPEPRPPSPTRSAAAVPRSPEPKPPVPSDRVFRLQQALARHGFFQGPLTGVEDAATNAAVRAFQGYLHDPQTGTPTAPEIFFLLNR